ncbi:MAG: hypothetical protein AB1668_05335 [Nanoarchaeota archaeon]
MNNIIQYFSKPAVVGTLAALLGGCNTNYKEEDCEQAIYRLRGEFIRECEQMLPGGSDERLNELCERRKRELRAVECPSSWEIWECRPVDDSKRPYVPHIQRDR